MLTSRGLGTVLGDLAAMGFDAKWGVLGAADVGANHQRDRIWIVARNMAYTSEIRPCGSEAKQGMERRFGFAKCGMDKDWWSREPANVSRIYQRDMDRVADGVAARVDRLKAIGNGQVPLCAATAWRILSVA
jgi:DNA (cytosine-5)-methyltransferase 1